MKNKYSHFIIGLVTMFFGLSCEPMDDTYSEFVEGGEIIYVQKADSIQARGGMNRLELSWLILSDPKVSSYKVLWNNDRDSIDNPINNTPGVDTVRVMLTDMREAVHNFKIFTYDDSGNSSVAAHAIGQVYGERYESSRLQRAFKSVSRSNDDMIVEWTLADNSVTFVELKYLDDIDNTQIQISPKENEIDTLRNFPVGGTFEYRTAFLPDSLALDTIYTPYDFFIEESPVDDEELDESLSMLNLRSLDAAKIKSTDLDRDKNQSRLEKAKTNIVTALGLINVRENHFAYLSKARAKTKLRNTLLVSSFESFTSKVSFAVDFDALFRCSLVARKDQSFI